MTREEIEADAASLGVPFNSRTSDETLIDRIQKARAEGQPETKINAAEGETADGDAPEDDVVDADAADATPDVTDKILAIVVWSNVWSSEGQHFMGDKVLLSPKDFDLMSEAGAVKAI